MAGDCLEELRVPTEGPSIPPWDVTTVRRTCYDFRSQTAPDVTRKAKMTRPQALEIAVLALVLAILSPATAWAYIDLGTGSYIFRSY